MKPGPCIVVVLEPAEMEALERFAGNVLPPQRVEDALVGLAMMMIAGEGLVPDDYVNRLFRPKP